MAGRTRRTRSAIGTAAVHFDLDEADIRRCEGNRRRLGRSRGSLLGRASGLLDGTSGVRSANRRFGGRFGGLQRVERKRRVRARGVHTGAVQDLRRLKLGDSRGALGIETRA